MRHKDHDRESAELSDRAGGEDGDDTKHGVVGHHLQRVRGPRTTESLCDPLLDG